MPQLSFQVEGAEPATFAANPAINLKLRVDNAVPRERIHTIALRCQAQMEVTRRRYSEVEQKRLSDLFGEPERWGQTLRSMLWANVSQMIPAFEGSSTVDLQLPCTFDFNIAATKYFDGLKGGEVPLCLMFGGTVFYAGETGALQAAPIPWDRETRYRLPVGVWKNMMDLYYPNTAWLNLRKDVFDRLNRYRMDHGIPAWEQVLERLLDEAESQTKEFAAS
jgi:hypothetical protein